MGVRKEIKKYQKVSQSLKSTRKKKTVKASAVAKKTVAKKTVKASAVAKKTVVKKTAPKKTATKRTVAKKAPDRVAQAVVKSIQAKRGTQSEEALKQELALELQKDTVKTQGFVKHDASPVNRTRDELIVEYAPLIKYIAQKISARLPANIELDDLISSGVIGLMDAIDKYDCSRDNKFKTYAEFRIRGAILDELRAQDWVPRSVREKAKMLERCYSKIEQETGRLATDDEVREELDLTKDEFHSLLNQVRNVSLLSFDEFSRFSKQDKRTLHGLGENGNRRTSNPFSEVNVHHIKTKVADAIKDLPEKQRLVLSLYYYEDLNLKEIGKVLDVTESRVSQLHTQAILRLKGRLRTHWDELYSAV